MVANAANAPVFVVDDVDVGKGTVGGYVVSWAADGQVAAGMAVRILDGVKPQEIPVVRNDDVYLFDWRALRRWGFKESDLPPGSTLLFKEISLWERTKWIWISGLIDYPLSIDTCRLPSVQPKTTQAGERRSVTAQRSVDQCTGNGTKAAGVGAPRRF